MISPINSYSGFQQEHPEVVEAKFKVKLNKKKVKISND